MDDAVERSLERRRRGDARRAHGLARDGGDAEFLKLTLAVRIHRDRGVHLLTELTRHEIQHKLGHRLDVARRVILGAVAGIDLDEHQRGRICAHSLEKGKRREIGFPVGGDRRDPSAGPRQDRRRRKGR